MAAIKYTDEKGEHIGSLTLEDYIHYGLGVIAPIHAPYHMTWNDTDYEPFKKAVNKKYSTTCEKAWLV